VGGIGNRRPAPAEFAGEEVTDLNVFGGSGRSYRDGEDVVAGRSLRGQAGRQEAKDESDKKSRPKKSHTHASAAELRRRLSLKEESNRESFCTDASPRQRKRAKG